LLPNQGADEAWWKGTSLGLKQAVEFESGSVAKSDGDASNPLTGQELQVVRLVADSLTTSEVSEKLRISLRAVDAHVDHIRNKVGLLTMRR